MWASRGGKLGTGKGRRLVPWKTERVGKRGGEDHECAQWPLWKSGPNSSTGLGRADLPPVSSSHPPPPHRATSPSLFSVQKGTQTTPGGKCHPAGPGSTSRLSWRAWACGWDPAARRLQQRGGFLSHRQQRPARLGGYHRNSLPRPQPPTTGSATGQNPQTAAPHPFCLIPSIQLPIYLHGPTNLPLLIHLKELPTAQLFILLCTNPFTHPLSTSVIHQFLIVFIVVKSIWHKICRFNSKFITPKRNSIPISSHSPLPPPPDPGNHKPTFCPYRLAYYGHFA